MKTQSNKYTSTIPQRLLLVPFSLGLMGLAPMAVADNLVVNSFDFAVSGINWENFRSYAYSHSEVWDPAQDSTANPNSGAMYLTVNWPTKDDPNWNQSWNDVQIAFGTPQINSADYISFEADIKVDVPNSFPALDGSYGAIELILNNPWQNVVSWAPLIATNGWQHFVGYFSGIPAGTYSEAILGFISNGSGTYTNTVSYWIDNIVFTAPPTVHTNQPAMAMTKAPPAGLTCVCSQAGGTWQRQMIATVNGGYSWHTTTAVSNTTTYSMTIAATPGGAHPAFASQMFLVPQSGMLGSPINTSIDWDSAHVVDLAVTVNADGTANGGFQYKVNNAGNWNAALSVGLHCATGPLGTWSMSFNNNTNVTLTAPDNTTTNFTIPESDASLFQDPLYFYVGAQPNNNASIGQSSTFSRVQIAGAARSINDTFSATALDANTWTRNAADAAGVFITAPDAKCWVTWSLPDYGFTNLYAGLNLNQPVGGSQWVGLPVSSTGWLDNAGAQRIAVINASALNAAFSFVPTNCFFGLFHP